jgi:hypothetical protein
MGEMKKIIILGFLFLFLASQTWSQEKCEAPVWKVGDKWTHKDTTGATYTTEVLDVKEDVFIVKNEATKSVVGIDKKTMNLKFFIGPDGKKVKATGVLRKFNDFPLFVGKKWTDGFTVESRRGMQQELNIMCDFKVEDIVEVKIPAGTFKAYVIYLKQGTQVYGGRYGWARHWYSPEVKAWIKREYEKSDYWVESRMQDAELISYELK